MRPKRAQAMDVNMQPDSPTTSAAAIPHRLWTWRRVQAFGGFALACSFFLPAVRACNTDYIPAEMVWDTFHKSNTGLAEWVGLFLFCIVAYLFGVLTVIVSLRSRGTSIAGGSRDGMSIAVLLGAVVFIALIGIVIEVRNPSSLDLGGGLFAVAVLISCAYWFRNVRMGAGGLLALRWYVSIACAVWFFCWAFDGGTRYGLWTSIGGSIAILAGCTQEARVRSRKSMWATMRALLTGNLQLHDLGEPRCFGCGYLLTGLSTPRCPECGQQFSWEDYSQSAPLTGSNTTPRGD